MSGTTIEIGMPMISHKFFILEAPASDDVKFHRLDGTVLESQLKLTPLKPIYSHKKKYCRAIFLTKGG